MMRRSIFAFVLVAFCALLPAMAAAEKRVALVIGNSAYQHASALPNPGNDAAAIAAELAKLGFEVVDGIDLDKAAMDARIRDFAGRLQGADAGLFFYAGHGLQVGGVNYLVPIDAQLATAAALDFEMVRLDLVQKTMERESKTNIIFLDACRDNPLARNLARAMGTRGGGVGRGLAAAESGVGTLISFSTQPGNVALDGSGANSPFAGALVKHMSGPSDISTMLIGVRRSVMAATSGKQVPWEHSALVGHFYFRPTAGDPAQGLVSPASPDRSSEAASAWESVRETADISLLDGFRRQFGAANPFYDRLAEARIETLRQQQEAAPSAAGSPPAPAPDTRELVIRIQDELRRAGCFLEQSTGNWGPKTRAAVAAFNERSARQIRSDGPTEETVTILMEQQAPLCGEAQASTPRSAESSAPALDEAPYYVNQPCSSWDSLLVKSVSYEATRTVVVARFPSKNSGATIHGPGGEHAFYFEAADQSERLSMTDIEVPTWIALNKNYHSDVAFDVSFVFDRSIVRPTVFNLVESGSAFFASLWKCKNLEARR